MHFQMHFRIYMSKTTGMKSLEERAGSFPSLVHRCLTEIDAMAKSGRADLQKIFSWQSDGLSFKVYNRKAFQEQVMPRFFPKLKYTSFIRQLTMFGFKKCENTKERRGGELSCKNLSTTTLFAANLTSGYPFHSNVPRFLQKRHARACTAD